MTVATLHSIWTLVLFICMIGVIIWAYSSRRKSSFDEAANMIFVDEKKQETKKTGEDKQ